MATKTFENATLRLKFSFGVNENGQIIEKTKTFRNVSEQASLDQIATTGAAMATLFQNPFIGVGLATQEAIKN